MTAQTETKELFYSSLGTDPILGEIVTEFVEEMPGRIEVLRQANDSSDWESLARLAHQLKGAGGSYGFDQLTDSARQLELVTNLGQEQEIQLALGQLIDICTRVRPGAPQ